MPAAPPLTPPACTVFGTGYHSCRCSIRQHTSAYASMRPHTSAYVRIRQHTSAYVSIRDVSIHQHTSAYVSIRQHTPACVSMRPHTSACVSIRQHASAYVSQSLFFHVYFFYFLHGHLRIDVARRRHLMRHWTASRRYRTASRYCGHGRLGR
jgi:hypothetical protein